MDKLRYRTGEEPRRGDRVAADPTTKNGRPRIGRVIGTGTNRGQRYTGEQDCCWVEWEQDTRRKGSPMRSDVPVASMDKIGERDIVANASARAHRIARIIHDARHQPDRRFGVSHEAYREPVMLADGEVVKMAYLCMGILIDQDVIDGGGDRVIQDASDTIGLMIHESLRKYTGDQPGDHEAWVAIRDSEGWGDAVEYGIRMMTAQGWRIIPPDDWADDE